MKYQCQICGYIHDEEKEGKSFKELEKCPDCKSDVSNFEIMKKIWPIRHMNVKFVIMFMMKKKMVRYLLNLENAQYAVRRYQNSKQSKKQNIEYISVGFVIIFMMKN